MASFDVDDAKTHLSQLLRRVQAGEEVLIARGGVPIARLVPLRASKPACTPGTWAGAIQIAEDFDDELLEFPG